MATNAHKIDNPGHWRHGLYCTCHDAPCRYVAKRPTAPPNILTPAESYYCALTQAQRDHYRVEWFAVWPNQFATVEDFAYAQRDDSPEAIEAREAAAFRASMGE